MKTDKELIAKIEMLETFIQELRKRPCNEDSKLMAIALTKAEIRVLKWVL